MQTISIKQISFIAEQDGEPERFFKKTICQMLSKYNKAVRAYLVCVAYDTIINPHKIDVVLCFRTISTIEENRDLAEMAIKNFQNQFNSQNKLDILFLTQTREIELRAVCCPFYISEGFQFSIPDFYLTSNDSPMILSGIISCFKRKKLNGQDPEGYMLCDISPAIVGQKFGWGGKDINKIVLFTRFVGDSLFNIRTWPLNVHVGWALCDLENIDYVDKSKIKSMIWGEIYKEPPLKII